MPEAKQQINLRLDGRTREQLAAVAAHWHVSQADVAAHGVDLLADCDFAAAIGGQYLSAKQAIACWSQVLDHAADDNARTFARAEWNLMADANNGCSPLMVSGGEDIRLNMPTTMLWANVADDIRLNGGDRKWKVKDPRGLVERLRSLDFAHAWAAVVAVQWFWEHCSCQIDHSRDEWWTPSFRHAHQCGGTDDA